MDVCFWPSHEIKYLSVVFCPVSFCIWLFEFLNYVLFFQVNFSRVFLFKAVPQLFEKEIRKYLAGFEAKKESFDIELIFLLRVAEISQELIGDKCVHFMGRVFLWIHCYFKLWWMDICANFLLIKMNKIRSYLGEIFRVKLPEEKFMKGIHQNR